MARPPITDASFGAAFSAEVFREKILETMNMGLPQDEDQRATFRWVPLRDWDVHDRANKPYHWNVAPTTEVLHEDVQIPVAVEFSSNSRNSSETTIGAFDTPRVIITVLDTHYDDVATANQVILGQNTYRIEFWAPPLGLFDVSVFQCYAVAMDES